MGSLFKRISTTFFALLFAVFSVNLTGVMTLQNAYADQPGTYQPVWCKLTGSGWKAQLADNGNGKDGPLLMTEDIHDHNLDNIDNNISNGSQVYAHDRSDKLDAACDTQFTTTPPVINEPVFIDECGTENDSITIPTTESNKFKYYFDYGSTDSPISSGVHTDVDEHPLWPGYQGTWFGNLNGGGTTIKLKEEKRGLFGIKYWDDVDSWSFTFTNATCANPVETEAPVVNTDECGTDNDNYFVPTVEGVIYKVNGNVVDGVVSTGGATSVVVTAEAAQGYVLTGQTSWTLNFDDTACPVEATTEDPTKVDPCDTDADGINIPSTTGVIYKINGQTASAGFNSVTTPGWVTVTAEAAQGYFLSANSQTQWTLKLTDKACVTPEEPVFVDDCGSAKDTYTLPDVEGIQYKVKVDGGAWSGPMNAGEYNYTGTTGTLMVRAFNKGGYQFESWVKTSDRTWSFDYTNVDCPVVATEPTKNDICGKFGDTFTTDDVEHVTYYAKQFNSWVQLNAGNHPAWFYQNFAGEVTIKAVADQGYVLTNQQSEWTLDFDTSKCDAPADDVTFVDVCGFDNDKFTVSTSDHVTYKKFTGWEWKWFPFPHLEPQFETITAGEYQGDGFVWIKAVADAGYQIDGQSQWIKNFNSDNCDTTGEVTGIDPSNDICSIENDTFEIDDVTGVGYQISVNGGNPQDIQPGAHYVADWAGLYYGSTADIKITAYALPNYNYVGQDTWEYTFTDEDCTTATGLCEPGKHGVLVTITNHKPVADKAWIATDNGQNWTEYDLDAYETIEVLVPTTNFLADVEVVASNESTVLKEAYDCTPGRGTTTPPVNTPTELPLTGPNPAVQLLTVVIAGLAAYGATLFATKRWNLGQDK